MNEACVAKIHARYLSRIYTQNNCLYSGTSFSEARHMRPEWLEHLQQFSWNTPATLALMSAAVGSVVSLVWISVRDAGVRKRQRHDTALEVALSLERYARTCRTMMHKAAWAVTSIGAMGREASNSVSIPIFAYPDKLQWQVLSRSVISELREFPATAHAAREHIESFREFGEPTDLCAHVEYECAKAARSALALARVTRRRNGAAKWKPGAKVSALEHELSDFIANAEEKRKASLERRRDFATAPQAKAPPFEQPLSA
ncbi:hypothetical protein [Paraburkholderia sp. RL17-347-BIC-D]|uniref:hypothetical protein n=1 Tax=Paraburkholderia sp. RL17-347-BIC-D TaxID=3031632 RepID=UPI0038BAC18B